MRNRSVQKTKKSQRGMTMIELMIALTVLAVGLTALLGLLVTAIGTNNRNKLDTGGTLVAQAVLETIASQPAGTPVNITDCAGNTVSLATAGAGGGAGAALNATDGSVDFTVAAGSVTSGYQAYYVSCGPAGNQVTYDVRWNIKTIASSSTYSEQMITVGAAQTYVAAVQNSAGQARYAKPITLRTISATGN